MRHLIARHNNYCVIGLKDRAYLVFDSSGNDAPTGIIIELVPSQHPKVIEQSVTSSAIPATLNVSQSSNLINEKQKPRNKCEKVYGRQKSADEQLNEICAVAVISNKDTNADESSGINILRCAVARNNKSLDIYTMKSENLPKTSQSPSLQYRTPKRVSCFAFAKIDEANSESSLTKSTIPLLITGDVAGDSYAYNLFKKGQRLLLGHTASMLTDIAIVNGGQSECNSNCLLLTSDRDEKIRISRFPETHVIEGFLLGHTAYVTGFSIVLSFPSALVVSCGGDMTLRLWDLVAQTEISSVATTTSSIETVDCTSNETNNRNEIPTAIATSFCGRFVALIFDHSRRLSIYKITSITNEGGQVNKPSLQLVGNLECPSQPLSISFEVDQRVKPSTGGNNSSAVLMVLMKDPDYVTLYNLQDNNNDFAKAITLPQNESRVTKALRDLASNEKIAMPSTILEKDDNGNPVLRKQNETRGPAATEAPWNRVERIEIAKEREKRRKKRPKLANDS